MPWKSFSGGSSPAAPERFWPPAPGSANAVLAGRRNAPMNDSELEHRAAEFWADTDLADAYPRNIEQAIALKLPGARPFGLEGSGF